MSQDPQLIHKSKSPHQEKPSSISSFNENELTKKPSNPCKVYPKISHQKLVNKTSSQKSDDSAIKLNNIPTEAVVQKSSKVSKDFRASKISDKYNESIVRGFKQNLKNSDTICAIFSCLALLIAWIENDIFFQNNNKSTNSCHILRGLVSFLCLITHYLINKHYNLELELFKSQRIIYQKTTLWSSNLYTKYIIEILFNYVHCPPFIDFVLPNEQLGIRFEISLDAYVSVVMLGRLYVFFRLFDHYTFWTGERATRVCRINGFLPDSKFAIKAYLKYKPYWVLMICLGCSILLFGFALRTFERPYTSPTRRFNFNYLWNSFWCVVVTMTTIGYGDIYPQTHLGRLVIIVACIWGVFILSLFVVALNNTITLTKEEAKAFEQITHQDTIKKGVEIDAANIIQKVLRLNLAKKKKIPNKRKILMRMDIVGLANRFKIKRKNANKVSKKISDILNDMHEEVNKDLGDLIQSIQPLKKTLPAINEAEEHQGTINDKTLEVYENSKKLMSLLIMINKGQLAKEVKSLDDMEAKFDFMGNPVEIEKFEESYEDNNMFNHVPEKIHNEGV